MRGVRFVFLVASLAVVASAYGATPALDPVPDVAARPFTNAGFVLRATDADPDDVLTFELVDPSTGMRSPLSAFLANWTVPPPQQAAIMRWHPSSRDAGRYPLRAVVRDVDGNEDTAEFTVTVYALTDDITGSFVGPSLVLSNTPQNPSPYRFTVDAASAVGLDLEYQIERQIRDGSDVTYEIYAPWQASPDFDLTFDEPDTYTLRAWVRSIVSEEPTYTNTTDGETIAQHYRDARGLPASALCPVPLPPGSYAPADTVTAAREIVLEECICENVLGYAPDDCVNASPSSIAGQSPISHLVFVKGVPERLVDTGATPGDDEEEPVLGYGFAGLGVGGQRGYIGWRDDAIDHQPSDAIHGHVRPVLHAMDKVVAYGHLTALDAERAMQLIDRTLEAEQAGFRGSVLDNKGETLFDFLRRLTDSRADPDPAAACTGYVEDPLTNWPHDRCRAGTTAEGLIPGEPPRNGLLQSIPYPTNVGLYLGRGLPPGGHHAFRGIDNMLNWRNEHPDDAAEPCVPLCRDHGAPDDVAACRAASTDYFREIDTRCVGGAPGLMGWQFRSWPVQYYGIQPPGWSLDTPGDREKTIPSRLTGSPFGDGYVHFGALDAVDNPYCFTPNRGVPVPCPEPLFVSMNLDAAVGPGHANAAAFNVRLRYRRGGSDGGALKVWLDFDRDGGGTFSAVGSLDLTAAQTDWTTATVTVSVPTEAMPLVGVRLRLASLRGDGLYGWLDLDHVELFDAADPGETNLLPVDVANFEAPYLGPTQPGDWAANAIDRLGGIAWWGSSSHYQTNGYAYYEADMFAGAFFGGRTLGAR